MIYFLIPVYNEEGNIEALSISLKASTNKEKFFLFVDDVSTDGTVNEIKRNFSDSSYHIITKETNVGPGDSFNRGFEWILERSKNDTDIILTIEGDNTSDANDIPKMIAICELGYDMVLASVYAQGGNLDKTTFIRKLLSFGANLIIRFMLDIKVLTLSSFYRVYKKSILQKIKNNNAKIIEEKGFLSMTEVLLKGIKVGASIVEIPTTLHSSRRKGKSKMKIGRTIKDYLRLILKSTFRA